MNSIAAPHLEFYFECLRDREPLHIESGGDPNAVTGSNNSVIDRCSASLVSASRCYHFTIEIGDRGFDLRDPPARVVDS
jgi:hypothetical protein